MNAILIHVKNYIKKYGSFLLFSFLILISISSTVALANLSTVEVQSNSVNVRVGPGLSYDTLTQVKKGEKLTIIDKQNAWWQVRLSGDKIGWVASWLINNSEISSTSNHIGIIKETGTNVYSSDSNHSNLLGTLPASQKVNIVYQEQGWNQILFGKTVGWVQNSYIQTTGKVANSIKKLDSNNKNTTSGKNKPKLKEDNIKTVTTLEADTKLRSTGSIDGSIVGTVPAQTTMKFINKKGEWYKVKTKSGVVGWVANWVVTISDSQKPVKTTASNLSEATIVLDAGHGGKDVGAKSINGKYEKTYTLKTVKAIKNRLRRSGAHIILARSNDKDIALGPRSRLSNKVKADAFISIHFDSSSTNNTASGTTTYYYDKSRDNKLATSINDQIKTLPLSNRGAEFGDFYVLRENNQPSVLLELGYINSSKDFKKISSNKYQEQIADAVYTGLTNYFK